MKVKANISLIKISEIVLSIKFTIAGKADVDMFRDFKGKALLFSLIGREKVVFTGRVVSIGVRRKAYFVVHTRQNKEVILKLLGMRSVWSTYTPATLIIGKLERQDSSRVESLEKLLDRISEKTGMDKKDLLKQLTSFEKDGKHYKGKEDLASLSEKQKLVLFSKAKRLLNE